MTSNNPFSNARREARRFKDEYALDMATVVETVDNSNHVVKIRLLEPDGTSKPDVAPVLMQERGDINIPEVGDYVLVGYARGRVPFVLGTLYKGGDSVPPHRVCERIIGHAVSDSEIRFNCDGSIDLTTSTFTVNATDISFNSDTFNINASEVNITGDTVLINGAPPGTGGGDEEGGVTNIGTTNTFDVRELSGSGRLYGLYMSPDGTKMYVIDEDRRVYEHTLSTPYDITSASFVTNVQFTDDTSFYDIDFKPDGTKMYLMGSNAIQEYTLSTAWDVTTASHAASGGLGNDDGMSFSDDGSILYTVGSNYVSKYTLSTPWDISTAAFDDSIFNPIDSGVYEGSSGDVYASNDGRFLYIFADMNDQFIVIKWRLNTPHDLSTMEAVNVYHNVVTDSTGIHVHEGRIWGTSFAGQFVYEITEQITTGGGGGRTYISNMTILDAFEGAPGDPELTCVEQYGDYIYVGTFTDVKIYDVSNPNNITFSASFTLPSSWPRTITADGNTLYVASGGDTLYSYDITTPTSPTFLDSLDWTTIFDGVAMDVAGNKLVIAIDGTGFSLVNITDPSNMTEDIFMFVSWGDNSPRGLKYYNGLFYYGREGSINALKVENNRIYLVSNTEIPDEVMLDMSAEQSYDSSTETIYRISNYINSGGNIVPAITSMEVTFETQSSSPSGPKTEQYAFHSGNNNYAVFKFQVDTEQTLYDTNGYQWGEACEEFPWATAYDPITDKLFVAANNGYLLRISRDGNTEQQGYYAGDIYYNGIAVDDSNIYLADIGNNRFTAKDKTSFGATMWNTSEPNGGSVASVCVSSDGRLYAMSDTGSTVHIYELDTTTGAVLNSVSKPYNSVSKIRVNTFGEILLVGNDGTRNITLYDSELIEQWSVSSSSIEEFSVEFAPDGDIISVDVFSPRGIRKRDRADGSIIASNEDIATNNIQWAASTPEYYLLACELVSSSRYVILRIDHETLDIDFMTSEGDTYSQPTATSAGMVGQHF